MDTFRFDAGPGARTTAVAILAVLTALVLGNCSERPDPLVGPSATGPAALSESRTGGSILSGDDYFSVPDPNWPGMSVWEGDLLVYAHGYYAPADDPWSWEKDVVEGKKISEIVTSLGYAYASTSYGAQGLVVPQAVDAVVALVEKFVMLNGGHPPEHVYLVGPSEGGLVTTLALEQHPGVFSGGLAMCGPIGDFRKQLDYFGDFHLLFNYFYAPNGVPGSPEGIPPVTDPAPVSTAEWEQTYKPAVEGWVAAYPNATRQLLSVSGAPIDAADPGSVRRTIVDILWYNLFATNDAIIRLGGLPFNNKYPYRWYRGSDNDNLLNRTIPRYLADPEAIATISQSFQTSGRLERPLVTMHTTGDPVVPYWHAKLYRLKALSSGSMLLHTNVPILRYGHCEFTEYEVLAGFAVLVLKVTGSDLLVAENTLPEPVDQSQLLQLAGAHGAHPRIVRALPQQE